MRISDSAWTWRARYGSGSHAEGAQRRDRLVWRDGDPSAVRGAAALAPVTRPRSPGILHHEGHILRCTESSVMRQGSQHVGAGLAERRPNNPLAVRRRRGHFPTRGPRRAPALPVVFPDDDLLWIESDLAGASVRAPGQSQTAGHGGGTVATSP